MTARRADRGERGLTLVELMVAMVLTTVMISVCFQISVVVLTGYRQHREAVSVQRAARGSLDLVADAVRNASAGVPSGQVTDAVGCTPFTGLQVTNATDGPDELHVIAASGSTLTTLRETFTEDQTSITVLDGTGLVAGDELLVTNFEIGHVVRITDVTDNGGDWTLTTAPITCAGVDFTYTPGAMVLRAKVAHFYVEEVDGVSTMFLDADGDGEDAPEPLAEGVEDFQIAVGVDVDGDGQVADAGDTTDEWSYNIEGDAAPDAVTAMPWRALRVTIVARSLREESGDWSSPPTVEDHEVDGALDGYRRRMVSTIVEIRNLAGSP